ncbi:hypothetical protein [Massilia glaciei]|uniref:hypothetical protein n=1 Tax=Massilia glaciei TaxID=1524097 RepID=UPI0015E8152B|nr:hypothetical protein [Massilia glaciei]
MPTTFPSTLAACVLALASSALCAAPAMAAPAAPAVKAAQAGKAKPGKARPKKVALRKPVPDALARPSEPEPDLAGTTATEFACELGNKVTTYHSDADKGHIALRWQNRVHRLNRVATSTGAHRFENLSFGLIWIGIPSKGMLLDSKLNRQLANECQSELQRNPPPDAPAIIVAPAIAPVPIDPAAVAAAPAIVPAPVTAPAVPAEPAPEAKPATPDAKPR